MQAFLRSDKVAQDAESLIIDGCKVAQFVKGKKLYCEQYVHQSIGVWLGVLVDQLSRDRICAEWLNFCSRPKIQEIDLKSEIADILSDKPDEALDNNFINNLYSSISG